MAHHMSCILYLVALGQLLFDHRLQYDSALLMKLSISKFDFSGLQDQLLSKVVYEERPELEMKFFHLIENLVTDRSRIRDLEDKCLDLLHSSEGNILDDEELISTIDDSKNTANTIQRKVEQSEGTLITLVNLGTQILTSTKAIVT